MIHILSICLLSFLPINPSQPAGVYLTQTGKVHFQSDAPLEFIEASSERLKGAIDPAKKTFAFSIEIKSFKGFNSPLQQTHFYENYLETDRFPTALFTGKIIEDIPMSEDGEYEIRAKGKLFIHGVEQERIIKSNITIENGQLHVHSNFTVLLQEHDITIPKIVYQKIAEEISVTVDAVFSK